MNIYRIEAVEDNQVSVSRLEGSVFSGVIPVPVHGTSDAAPFLYRDLVRAAGTLQKGTVVSIKEKVPRDQIRRYRIRSVHSYDIVQNRHTEYIQYILEYTGYSHDEDIAQDLPLQGNILRIEAYIGAILFLQDQT